MKTLLTILTATICLHTAQSTPIEYRWTGTGSGEVVTYYPGEHVTNSFTEAPFSITATADTDDITGGPPWSVPNEKVVFSVNGADSMTLFLEWTLAGRKHFPPFDPPGSTICLLFAFDAAVWGWVLANPDLEDYDLSTSFGPVTGPLEAYGQAIPWMTPAEGGYIMLAYAPDVTFEAVLIPEPSTVILLGFGALGLALVRRRRRAAILASTSS